MDASATYRVWYHSSSLLYRFFVFCLLTSHNEVIDAGHNNLLFAPGIDMDRKRLRLSHRQKRYVVYTHIGSMYIHVYISYSMIGYQQWENTVILCILESRRCTYTWQDLFSVRAKLKQDCEPDSMKCIQASISIYLNDGECWYLRHRIDIAEILLKVALNTKNQSIKSTNSFKKNYCHISLGIWEWE
jgi:hypothetical protein